MAGALALTCLGRIGDIVLGKVGDYLVAPIQRQFQYLCCFNSNITELQTQFKKLETTKEEVQLRVDEDLRNVRTIAPQVKDWLEKANKVTPNEIEGIINDKAKVKEGCLNGWCPNLKLRYSLSRKAVKKTKDVVVLQADEASYNKPSLSPQPAATRTIPSGDFMGFESRSLVMEETIKALKHDEINLIGVCGMGGVGKTILVKEAANRVKEDKHFDEVAMVVVGQKPDLTDVQDRISDMLGLKILRETKGPEARADLLRTRLLQDNKKVLIILDDVWEDFDLQGMGIPLGGANKNFKMLYTSRNRNLWHQPLPIKKEIPLELLSEEEALQLFKEKVGDSADARDLQPIAKQIVHECGRLPLALALIGSALSKKRAIKEIWEDMLGRLTRAPSTLVDNSLYSRLVLSYEYLEDEEAKRLFLLCCLFKEDQNIRIEDLARYGLGLSIFYGTNKMGEARGRVLSIIDDLKSRHLLLDGEDEEYVKVHDVVRDMGISIASKIKFALVIHGEVSEWPKKYTYEDYTCISLISRKVTELPKGLKCPDLEFLLLECRQLKELPCEFFQGMGKLKVLVLHNFKGILTLPSTLSDLHTLSLPNFNGKFDNASEFGKLLNLKTLSFPDSWWSWNKVELPEEIGEVVNLRLLDLTGAKVERIPAGVISRLVQLEELNVFNMDWEENDEEEEGRYASLGELEFLSNLDTLEISIKGYVVIPKFPIFSKLKIYNVLISGANDNDDDISDDEMDEEIEFLSRKCKRRLMVESSILIPSNRGGIDSLLRSSDFLRLEREGCNDLMQALLLQDGVDDRLQQLKYLSIKRCDTPECLANTVDLPIFPILKVLKLQGLVKLTEICSAPIPARSFGDLTSILVHDCGGLRNLFQLPIVGCLTQLKRLIISSCGAMEEVIWKKQQEDVHVGTNNSIEFPKLEVLRLVNLPSLMGFCRGIDHIDFPELKELELEGLEQFNRLFNNNYNMYSNSEQNDNFGLLSLFHQKVSIPNLEVLRVKKVNSLERLGPGLLLMGSFSKLKEVSVSDCGKLLSIFPSQLLSMVRGLSSLNVERCKSLEVVFELEGLGESSVDEVEFPQLKMLELSDLPKLASFFPNVHVNATTLTILFNKKVSFPNLEVLIVKKVNSLERLGLGLLSMGSFSKLKEISVSDCGKLLSVFPSQLLSMLRGFSSLTVERCKSLEVVFELEGLGESSVDEVEFRELKRLELSDLPKLVSFFPNVHVNATILAESTDHPNNSVQPQPLFNKKVAFPVLEYLHLDGLQIVSDVWGSELRTSSFPKLKTLYVKGCVNLRITFHPSTVRRLANLSELVIEDCSKMEGVVYWEKEEDGGGRKVEKTLLCRFRELELRSVPNLVPNVRTITLAKSTDYHNPLLPQAVFNEKVAQLLYANYAFDLLALGSNGNMTLWKWKWKLDWSNQNQSCTVTPSVFVKQRQLASGVAMPNGVTGVNLEEAVPCMALSKKKSYGISSCGGEASLFDINTLEVLTTFMPPRPASKYMAFHPEDDNIVAIGMEDSTICIFNVGREEVIKSELKGHEKRITGLAFSTKLNMLVSSGADAQLCKWNIDTWEHLKSVRIQLPAGKACNGDTRVEFHCNEICLLVSHETQLAIYDASNMDRIRQWVPQDVLPAPISFATYSKDSELVYTSFCDGNIGVFDANSLTLTCLIAPSIYLSPALLSGDQAVYPTVIAANTFWANKFAVGLTNGSIIVMYSNDKWGVSPTVENGMLNDRTASSSNTNQEEEKEKVDEEIDADHRGERLARAIEAEEGEEKLAKQAEPGGWRALGVLGRALGKRTEDL